MTNQPGGITHQEVLDRLDDFVDGALSSTEARRLEEHVAACPQCHEALTGLGALLDAATGLRTRGPAPRRDLWPAISRRIGAVSPADGSPVEAPARVPAAPAGRAGPFERLGRLLWPAVSVAAILVLGLFLTRAPRRPAPEMSVPGLDVVETETSRARGDFESLLRGNAKSLPAGSDFEKNLRLLDEAIRDSRAALEADPRDQGLQRSLLIVYQTQLDLLRWATRLIQET